MGEVRLVTGIRLRALKPCLYQVTVSGEKSFRLAVLGSGKGSNFAAIADGCAKGAIPAEVAVVVSDVVDAGILAQARQRGIEAAFIAPGKFRTKLDEEAETRLVELLTSSRINL